MSFGILLMLLGIGILVLNYSNDKMQKEYEEIKNRIVELDKHLEESRKQLLVLQETLKKTNEGTKDE